MASRIRSGYCRCGCGQKVRGRYKTLDRSKRRYPGRWYRFITGHNSRVSGYGRSYDLMRVRGL